MVTREDAVTTARLSPADAAASEIRICTLIPTYNNATTIETVIESARKYCSCIIVVNDGSTDATAEILSRIDGITTVTLERNSGKGSALDKGFSRARELGFSHAVSFDADGQHVAGDIPAFKEAVESDPTALWIGNRSIPFGETTQPARSRFGRGFGNFWYKYNTGIRLHDTQCGFRAYPLARTSGLKLKGTRYEYEQEVLIKAAWNAIPVRELDIHLFYQPKAQRISHFRPIIDFWRISIVNGKAGFISTVFPMAKLEVPGDTVFQKIQALVKQEVKAHTTPKRAAISLSIGLLLGLSPFHGFQVLMLIGLSMLLKLNRPLGFLGVSISSAPMLPFLILISVTVGKVLIPESLLPSGAEDSTAQNLAEGGIQYVVGSLVLSVVVSTAAFLFFYPLFKRIESSRRRRDT